MHDNPRRFGRLRELDISGSSWSPRALIALLRGARDSAHRAEPRLHARQPRQLGPRRRLRRGRRRRARVRSSAPAEPRRTRGLRRAVPRAEGVRAARGGRAGSARGWAAGAAAGVFSALEELSFQRNAAVNDDVLARIAARCVNLARLDVRGTTVSREGIAAFARDARCAPRPAVAVARRWCDSVRRRRSLADRGRRARAPRDRPEHAHARGRRGHRGAGGGVPRAAPAAHLAQRQGHRGGARARAAVGAPRRSARCGARAQGRRR